MKNLISVLLTGSMLTVMGIAQADMLTGRSITDAYVSGQLDKRIEELGTNLQTQEKMPLWKSRQNKGLFRHCTFKKVTDKQTNEGCKESFARNGF